MDLRRDPPTPPSRIKAILKGVYPLVLFVSIQVKDIARLGRLFPWPKPAACPRCHGKLWWHGFVVAYFSCCREAVYLRRLRCSCCGAVHRLRPSGYFRRFRSSIAEITRSMSWRSTQRKWCPDLPRSRQRQWWRSLLRNLWLLLGRSFSSSPIKGFHLLFKDNIIPVSRAGQKENQAVK